MIEIKVSHSFSSPEKNTETSKSTELAENAKAKKPTKKDSSSGSVFFANKIQQAFDIVKTLKYQGKISRKTPVCIELDTGEYEEILSYNFSNPLIMKAKEGVAKTKCIVKADNCEAFHKDTQNRSVFVLGPNCTKVILQGFCVENTHEKTSSNEKLGNQAEALCFHNQNGTLFAKDMSFSSCQDTVHLKGFCYFLNCKIEGDVDFIWGYANLCLFEHCILYTKKDSRGDFDTYVLQARALNGAKGFIFKSCVFLAQERQNAKIYIARSSGKGSKKSPAHWDSIALIDCVVQENYEPCFFTDENGKRKVFPNGSVHCGFREYGTLTQKKDGTRQKSDFSNRYATDYILKKSEYEKYYSSTKKILKKSPLL